MFRAESWGTSCSASAREDGGGVVVLASIASMGVNCVDGGSIGAVMEDGDEGLEGGPLVDIILSVATTSSTGVSTLFILPVIASMISCAATLMIRNIGSMSV